MTLDARSQILDSRSADVDASHSACCAARGVSEGDPADDEITVVRLAGDRDPRASQALDDEVTVLRIAHRIRKTS